MFTPKNLRRWTKPSCYIGAEWPEYYGFFGRSRDSGALENANFDAGLKAIGGEANENEDLPLVKVVRESHWAVGWVEWIAIHESADEQLKIADTIKAKLYDYPVVDESLLSEYEQRDADETWKNCFRPRERIAWIREHRSQFEFRDFRDMLACVRGEYFSGCACELLN